MFYIIEYELLAFIALLIVAMKYFYTRYFPSHQNRIFGYIILVTLISLFLDLITAYTINAVFSIPFWINQLLNTLYYGVQTINPPLLLIYTLLLAGNLSFMQQKRIKLIFLPTFVVLFILFFINPLTGLYFYIDPIKGYSYGVWFYSLHFMALIYLSTTFMFAVHYKNRLSSIQYQTITSFIFAVLVTMIIQANYPELLITGVVLSFAVIVMYFTLQNPQQMKDVLTGAFNYNAMLEYLYELIKSRQKFHLIAININDLSRINRMFGLKNGNRVLIEIADYITNQSKDVWVFRMKGTRFVAIMNDDTSYYKVKANLEYRLESSWNIDSNEIYVSTSLCCIFNLNDYVTSIDDVVNLIETSYIQSEVNGVKKKMISSDNGLFDELGRMMAVESALRDALNTGIGLELNFQPVYSVNKKQFTSAETLLRFTDPLLGSISPSEFVPIAEKNGLVLQLDLLVVEKVCQFIEKHNPKETLGLDYLGINLSAAEFMNRQMPEKMTEILNRYQIDPDFIIFEITETVATVSYEIVSSCMQEYRVRGFRFALDDFGTGFANLSQVVSLPFTMVKIDRGLIHGSKIVLEDLLRMFKRLGLITVIEGIETAEQSLL
ncbi:MAG TPA: EAL domain-containing protein, partial [Erysipelotrichaceae bacterium]|nr:EAL domain-containing protein [Erysipelotrichaceae bacterium]